MLAITVEFLHGTFRGASADDTALMGGDLDSGEWPPSPARLFSALVAADGTGNRQRVTDGSELALLESASPPIILADASPLTLATQLHGRFVVADDFHRDTKSGQTGAVQEYVGRTATLVRPGTRRALADPTVTYLWQGLKVPKAEEQGLRARAARVGYLGCADSPVRLSVRTEGEIAPSWERMWEPADDGATVLPVPWSGFRQALDDAFAQWSGGLPMRRSWLPTRYARYRGPDDPRPDAKTPCVSWLRFATPVPGRRVLAVTEALREAVLQGYQVLSGGEKEAVPQVLHGHGFTGTGYQHAHWFALPSVGHKRADGMIRGAAVWLPANTEAAVVERVQEALGWLTTRELGRAGQFATRVALADDQAWGPPPVAVKATRWQTPSRRWASAFPVIYERFSPGGPTGNEVTLWCQHAGIQQSPVAFRVARVPFIRAGVSLAATEAHRGATRHPFGHLELLFAEPVRGPIALGRGRQFGLGLMAPITKEKTDG